MRESGLEGFDRVDCVAESWVADVLTTTSFDFVIGTLDDFVMDDCGLRTALSRTVFGWQRGLRPEHSNMPRARGMWALILTRMNYSTLL
jgi:hypothetical protein